MSWELIQVYVSLIKLKVSDVKDLTYIKMHEQKTGKFKRIKISGIADEIEKYISGMDDDTYLFKSQKGDNSPISRVQSYRILNKAAVRVGIISKERTGGGLNKRAIFFAPLFSTLSVFPN